MPRRCLTSYARPRSRRSWRSTAIASQCDQKQERAHKLSLQISSGDRQRTGSERQGTVTSSAKSQAERGQPLRARQAAASQASRIAAGVQKTSSRTRTSARRSGAGGVEEIGGNKTQDRKDDPSVGIASDTARSSGGSLGTRPPASQRSPAPGCRHQWTATRSRRPACCPAWLSACGYKLSSSRLRRNALATGHMIRYKDTPSSRAARASPPGVLEQVVDRGAERA